MTSWTKSLERKTFSAFSIPTYILEDHKFEDGKKYAFKIKAGKYKIERVLKLSSGREVSIPKDLAERLQEVANQVQYATFECDGNAILDSEGPPPYGSFYKDFENEVQKAMLRTKAKRLKRLESARKKPKQSTVFVTVYARNPDVVAEVLVRADGKCEACKKDAPFKRKKDESPYLEVHHRVRLADGGDDTLANAIALCPNCHRKEHYG